MFNKKIIATITFNIKAFFTLFICEIGGLLMFSICFYYLPKIILGFVFDIFIATLAYLLIKCAIRMSEINKIKGSILYLSHKNEIHMKSKYVKHPKDFFDDYNLIVNYAKLNNINKLHTTTHFQILKILLKGYKCLEWTNVLNVCKHMDYSDTVYVETQKANIAIKKHVKSINPCGRYEYKSILFLFHLKKVFEVKDFYNITIHLIND